MSLAFELGVFEMKACIFFSREAATVLEDREGWIGFNAGSRGCRTTVMHCRPSDPEEERGYRKTVVSQGVIPGRWHINVISSV
jgi:hypothetical protein